MPAKLLLIDVRPIRAARLSAALRALPNVRAVEVAVSWRRAEALLGEWEPDGLVLAEHLPSGPGASPAALAPAFVLPAEALSRVEAATPAETAQLVASLTALQSFLRGLGSGAASDVPRGMPPLTRSPDLSPVGPLAGRSPPLVCIGASTGGLPVIERILDHYPAHCPPTLVVQHIRGSFTASLAARLARSCRAEVSEAWDGAPIEAGRVYLAPGETHHLQVSPRRRDGPPTCRLTEGDRVSGHRPSVDALFRSAAMHAPNVIGVLLTGMGRDGAEGLLSIRTAGGRTLVQDAATSVVYGMPRVATELGAAERNLPADEIGPAILRLSGLLPEHQGEQRP